jgi:hypothetical protein
MGLGQRFTQATASSMSLTSQSQKPATSSRVSAKGPSMTVRRGPSNATRLPCDEGLRPSPASMMPALTSSSLYLPIASNSSAVSVVGEMPFSLSSVAFTNTITRIVCPLLRAGLIDLASGRRTGFSEIDIVLQFLRRSRRRARMAASRPGTAMAR